MVLSLNKLLSVLLFITCLFPYISPISTPFDTQPYAIVIAFIIIVLVVVYQKNIEVPKLLVPFSVVLGYSIVVFMLNADMVGVRSLVGYVTVFVVALAAFLTFNKVKGKHFIGVVVIWLVFGVIQQFVMKSFGSFLVARISTSESRGVTSLAVEPSYYSIICVFFLILNDIFFAKGEYGKKTHRNVLYLIVIQFLLSRSGIGFVLFFVYLISRVIAQRNFVKTFTLSAGIVGLFVIVVSLYTSIPSLESSRIGRLIFLFSLSPESLFLNDGSVSDRFSHIAIPFLSIFSNYGLGFGFGGWDANAMNIASSIGGFVHRVALVNISFGNRIMSGWGAAIFELGVFGVLLVFSYIYLMIRGIKSTKTQMQKVYTSSLITLFSVMLMAVPLAFPLFGYMVGVFINLQLNRGAKSKELTEDKISLKAS